MPSKEVQFEELFRLEVQPVTPSIKGTVTLHIAEEFSSVEMTVEDALRLSTLLVRAARSADGTLFAELILAQKQVQAIRQRQVPQVLG